MTVTTSNVSQLGMLVTGGCYRNPDLLAKIGRDPAEIERTVWIERADPDLMGSLVDAGAEHLILGLRAPYDLTEVERLVAAR